MDMLKMARKIAGEEQGSPSEGTPSLVTIRLEYDTNSDGVSWYAYFSSTPSSDDLERAGAAIAGDEITPDVAKVEPSQMGSDEFDLKNTEEHPNTLSKYAGLSRWFIVQGG